MEGVQVSAGRERSFAYRRTAFGDADFGERDEGESVVGDRRRVRNGNGGQREAARAEEIQKRRVSVAGSSGEGDGEVLQVFQRREDIVGERGQRVRETERDQVGAIGKGEGVYLSDGFTFVGGRNDQFGHGQGFGQTKGKAGGVFGKDGAVRDIRSFANGTNSGVVKRMLRKRDDEVLQGAGVFRIIEQGCTNGTRVVFRHACRRARGRLFGDGNEDVFSERKNKVLKRAGVLLRVKDSVAYDTDKVFRHARINAGRRSLGNGRECMFRQRQTLRIMVSALRAGICNIAAAGTGRRQRIGHDIVVFEFGNGLALGDGLSALGADDRPGKALFGTGSGTRTVRFGQRGRMPGKRKDDMRGIVKVFEGI